MTIEEYRQENKEKTKKRNREYYLKNKDKIKEQKREYRLKKKLEKEVKI